MMKLPTNGMRKPKAYLPALEYPYRSRLFALILAQHKQVTRNAFIENPLMKQVAS